MDRVKNIRSLITFIRPDSSVDQATVIKSAVTRITEAFSLETDVFVYERMEYNGGSLFATFKAEIPPDQRESPLENTKFINRNARTNTLYTINALNRICLLEIGREDKNHPINWSRYRNKIVMLRNSPNGDRELVEHDIRLISRFNYETGVESIYQKEERG